MSTFVAGRRSLRILVASSPSIPGMRTSMMMTFGLRRSAIAIALAPSEASPITRTCGDRESERRRPSRTTSWSSAIKQVISSGTVNSSRVHSRAKAGRTLQLPAVRVVSGLLVDPLDGAYPGVVRIEADRIVSVERTAEPEGELHVLPGFVDLHVYDPEPLARSGVTSYLLATRAPVDLPD